MRIRYINAKYPGATHDANVFNMSALKQQLEEEYRRGERNMLLGMLWLICVHIRMVVT